MDANTRKAFVAHVCDLERRCMAGDEDAVRSLSCMALLVANSPDHGPDGGEVVYLHRYRIAA